MTFKPAFEGQGTGFDQRPESVIRRGHWKLFESLETGEVQLYNLHDDIGETTDVSKENPELVASLKSELRASWKEVDADMPIPKTAGQSAVMEIVSCPGSIADHGGGFATKQREFLAGDFLPGLLPDEVTQILTDKRVDRGGALAGDLTGLRQDVFFDT